jgi:hypothetical protein
MNCKTRKILARSPDDLWEIMALLPPFWKVVTVNDSGRHYWNASIQSPKKEYRLFSDRIYVEIYQTIMGQEVQVTPPDRLRASISFAQVADLLIGLDSSSSSEFDGHGGAAKT